MDQVTQVKKHLRSEHWKKLISECQSSGITVTSWWEQNGIVVQTYYRNLTSILWYIRIEGDTIVGQVGSSVQKSGADSFHV